MSWSALGTQFCLELALGVLVALAFVPKAPVGALFYRVMGTSALVPILIAIAAPLATGVGSLTDPSCIGAGVAALAYPVYSGPVRGRAWAIGLAVGILGCLGGVVAVLAGEAGVTGPSLALAAGSAAATGVVAGSVGLAMVLGHWYLTVPNLHVRYLRRLNWVTVGAMLVSLLLLGATLLTFGDSLSAGGRSLAGPTGLFHLGTRTLVGLVLPLVFAWMAASSLRYENTRSATGILYASTVLVLIGTAVSVSLQGEYGFPL